MTFPGYRRPDGQVGIRNHIAIIPTVICANQAASAIAEGLPAVAVPHIHGCSFDARQDDALEHILTGTANNPNVAAALVIALGCESSSADAIVEGIARSGKPVEALRIQDCGTVETVRRGREIVERLLQHIGTLRPEQCGAEELIVAVECGGSDAFSGLSANPAVGAAADLLVEQGGTVVLSETTEIIGAEQVLARRCADEETRARLLEIVARAERSLASIEEHAGGVYITPGNIAGGLTTLEEKSLGCIHKGGHTPVQEVLGYAQRPAKKGLVLMDTPGQDVEQLTAMIAGGSQIAVFTTGRGNPMGSPIAPVIKVSTNSALFSRMEENMDLDAGVILSQGKSIAEVGQQIVDEIVQVANGKLTKAEVSGERQFGFTRIGPTT